MSTPDDPTWIELCAAQIQEPDARRGLEQVLAAFAGPFPRGGPPPPPELRWSGSFAEFCAYAHKVYRPDEIGRVLATEVDTAQAKLFVRRLGAVIELLEQRVPPNLAAHGQALRAGLCLRAFQISQTTTTKTLRIRALADFYYTQAAKLMHKHATEHAPTLSQVGAKLCPQEIAPGIAHAHYDGPSEMGPLHLNALRIDPSKVQIQALNCREHVARQTPFAQWASPLCDAAVSGGFFLYSESDIQPPSARRDPVGLLISDGVVHNPPTFARAAFCLGPNHEPTLLRVGPLDHPWQHQGRPITVRASFNRAQGLVGPSTPSVSVVGRKVLAVGTDLPVPLNGVVLETPDHAKIRPGDELVWQTPWRQAIAGGPMILEQSQLCIDLRREDFWGTAPPVTFSQDETGDTNLLARLALGLTPQGELWALAVDGRNFERALGMTLAGMGQLMLALGCQRAANMDGGSSKRMLVQGRTVDLPSTEVVAGDQTKQMVRPVHSALLFKSRG